MIAIRISHKHRFIFFAFPKTGSESVRKALDPISDIIGRQLQQIEERPNGDLRLPDHLSPVEARDLFLRRGWDFNGYYRFVFVRNPWTRLVSLYRMFQSTDPLPFGEWLLRSRTDGAGGGMRAGALRAQRFGTYTLDSFTRDEAGVSLVNEVFRMEDMPQVPAILRQRGLPLEGDVMPFVNRRGPPTNYNEYYSPALSAVVAMRYAKDIRDFGYRYPG